MKHSAITLAALNGHIQYLRPDWYSDWQDYTRDELERKTRVDRAKILLRVLLVCAAVAVWIGVWP